MNEVCNVKRERREKHDGKGRTSWVPVAHAYNLSYSRADIRRIAV
jgi:hypothetical protein